MTKKFKKQTETKVADVKHKQSRCDLTHARAIQGTSRSLNVRFKNPEEATSPMAGICKSVIAAIFVWLVPQDMNFCSSYMPPSYETLDLHASLLLRALHRNGSFSLFLEITNILFVFTNFFFIPISHSFFEPKLETETSACLTINNRQIHVRNGTPLSFFMEERFPFSWFRRSARFFHCVHITGVPAYISVNRCILKKGVERQLHDFSFPFMPTIPCTVTPRWRARADGRDVEHIPPEGDITILLLACR